MQVEAEGIGGQRIMVTSSLKPYVSAESEVDFNRGFKKDVIVMLPCGRVDSRCAQRTGADEEGLDGAGDLHVQRLRVLREPVDDAPTGGRVEKRHRQPHYLRIDHGLTSQQARSNGRPVSSCRQNTDVCPEG